MKKALYNKIIKALEKAGFGRLIYERDGGIYVSAEDFVEIDGKTTRAGDYYEYMESEGSDYGAFGINKKIIDICDKLDCFCEWETPGTFAIWEV